MGKLFDNLNAVLGIGLALAIALMAGFHAEILTAEAVLANIVNWEFVARNLDEQGASRADQEPVSLRVTEPIA